MKLQTIAIVYNKWCLACRATALSEVYKESFPKFVTSFEAVILAQSETVVSIKAQLVNGMKKPFKSIYKKYVT